MAAPENRKDLTQFENIFIIKPLSNGYFGTTYLAIHDITKKVYVIKTQKISSKDITIKMGGFTISERLSKELDIYDLVNTFSEEDKCFFNKLHQFSIYTECKHKQKDKAYLLKTPEYAKSPFCVDFLLEYAGRQTLFEFMQTEQLTLKILTSIILQILKIVLILGKAGFIDSDIHLNNLMINNTDKKFFKINNKKIDHCGYQVVLIDYGITYAIDQKNKNIDMLNIIYPVIHDIISFCPEWRINWLHQKNNYTKLFKVVPNICKKYFEIFPEEDIQYEDIWLDMVTDRVVAEVEITMPHIFKKYIYGSCKTRTLRVTEQVFLDFLCIPGFTEMITFWQHIYKSY